MIIILMSSSACYKKRSIRSSFLSTYILFLSPFICNKHGISSPPNTRSVECLLVLVTSQATTPPRRRNNEKIFENFFGKCPTILLTLTAYRSTILFICLAQHKFHQQLESRYPYRYGILEHKWKKKAPRCQTYYTYTRTQYSV